MQQLGNTRTLNAPFISSIVLFVNNQPIRHYFTQSQSISQSVGCSVIQSVGQSVSHLVSQSASHSVGQFVSQ